MIRAAVVSESDDFHRAIRQAGPPAGIRVDIARRSYKQPLPTRSIDVIIVHNPDQSEMESVIETSEGLPLVVAAQAIYPPEWFSNQDGWAALSDDNMQAILIAATAVTFGLTVGQAHPDLEIASVASRAPTAELTDRELDVLKRLGRGSSNREIAALLGISENTVKYHLGGIYRKLGVTRRSEMVFEAIRRGLISI